MPLRPALVVLVAAAVLAPAAAAQIAARTLVSPNAVANGAFGSPIAGVPDVDGDGAGDLAVLARGESNSNGSSGRLYLFSGATGALLRTLSSPQAGGSLVSVAGVPDTNGDGRGDVLVGAPGEGSQQGRVYLFSGATGALLRTLTSPTAETLGFFGQAVAGVPDADGDGRGDLLIGAPLENTPEPDAGRAHLFSGATGILIGSFLSPNREEQGQFGQAVAGVPDADGDGLADLLVGASFEDVGGLNSAGRAYLFSGATRALLRTLTSPGDEAAGLFGRAVAGVADANGDGRGDLVVSAPGETVLGAADAGRVHLFSGATGALLRSVTSPDPVPDGEFGTALSAVPDADGDGRGDIGVGTLGEGAPFGRAHVFSGATGALVRTLRSPNAEADGGFGRTVAGVPDTNGDGRGDLLVGAPQEDGGAPSAGRTYLFSTSARTGTFAGPAGWRLLALPLASTTADLLAEAWTQGAAGADASDGDPSVLQYTEPTPGPRNAGYTGLPDLTTADRPGQGRAVYLFEDDDLATPGTQGGFPKTLGVVGHRRSGHPVAFPVSFTASGSVQDDGWNLVGNPFDAGLDWDAAGWTRTRLDHTIYVWDRAAGVFRTWNGTAGSLGDGVVAEFQGFWVKANSGPPVLVAPAVARVTTAPPQTPLGPSLGLRLAGTLAGQPVDDVAFVAFVDGAADALDPFDAYELAPFSDTYAALYTEGPGALLDVEARGPLDGPTVFTLGAGAVAAGQAAGGTFTLAWPDLATVPADWGLTLTDLAAGASVDLRAQPSYTFTLAVGLAPERVLSGSILTPPVPTPLAFAAAEGFAPPTRFLLRVEPETVAGEGRPTAALTLDAFPNPVAGPAHVAFTLPAAADVRVVVLDALGREVAVLADGARPAGRHDVLVATDRLVPGVYVVRMTAAGSSVARRLTVIR